MSQKPDVHQSLTLHVSPFGNCAVHSCSLLQNWPAGQLALLWHCVGGEGGEATQLGPAETALGLLVSQIPERHHSSKAQYSPLADLAVHTLIELQYSVAVQLQGAGTGVSDAQRAPVNGTCGPVVSQYPDKHHSLAAQEAPMSSCAVHCFRLLQYLPAGQGILKLHALLGLGAQRGPVDATWGLVLSQYAEAHQVLFKQ